MNIKPGDLVSYKGVEDTVEDVVDNEVLIQNQNWESNDDDIGFWIWVKISDLDLI